MLREITILLSDQEYRELQQLAEEDTEAMRRFETFKADPPISPAAVAASIVAMFLRSRRAARAADDAE